MALNQIPVPLQGWGLQLMNFRTAVLQKLRSDADLKADGAAILAKLAAMIDGNDYTRLEQQLQLQPGQGTVVFAQLNSAVGNFADGNQTQAAAQAAQAQFAGFIG